MSKPVTEADFDDAVRRAHGRPTSTMRVDEAAVELSVARAFDRAPDPRAVETQRRVQAAQEAVRDLAPWRAVVRWDQYDELVDLEERFAELTTSRRGQTMESSRSRVGTLLREAWTKSGPSQGARFAAVEKALRDGFAQLERLSPLVPGRPAAVPAVAERRTPQRTQVVTEADFDRAVARAYGRRPGQRTNEEQR